MLKKNLKLYNYNVFEEFDKGWPILTCGDRENGVNSMTISWEEWECYGVKRWLSSS